MNYEHSPGFLDTELVSAILTEKNSAKQDLLVDSLNEEEAKILCKFLLLAHTECMG